MTTLKRAPVVLMALGLTGCTSVLVGGGPTADLGTIAVGGVHGGVGAHAEAGIYKARAKSDVGGVISLAVAGYTGDNDGDPIFFTTLEARYRSWLGAMGAAIRPFLELGGGPTVTWISSQQAGVTGHVALGLAGGGHSVGWWLSLRERPAFLYGRQPEFFNSTQLLLGIELHRSR